MYRYQNEIKFYELRGRNNEPLYNDNAFLVSILTKINENIEKIDFMAKWSEAFKGEPPPMVNRGAFFLGEEERPAGT